MNILKHGFLLLPIFYFIFSLSACKDIGALSPSYLLTTKARLADGGTLALDLKIKCKEKSDIQKIKEKLKQIKYAFRLIFSHEKSNFLEDRDGRMKTINSAERVLLKYAKSKITGIEISHFEITPYKNKYQKG